MLSKRILSHLNKEVSESCGDCGLHGKKEEFSVQSCEHHLFVQQNQTPLTVYDFHTAVCNDECSVNTKDQ